jgi:S1-C subfamily serine protease
VDDAGRVIGVPTAIESPVRANAGIGFAVPSAIVRKVVPALIANGSYEHAWLGISGNTLRSDQAEAMGMEEGQRGVLVAEVVPGGPASDAGLRGNDAEVQVDGNPVGTGGDVIVAIDGTTVREFDELVAHLARNVDVGQTVSLTILRDGQELDLEVALAARPMADAPQPPAMPQPGDRPGRGWLGIQGLTLTPELAGAAGLDVDQQGILVVQVISGTPAEEAGLLGGDQVVEVEGQPILVGGDVVLAVDGEDLARFEELRAALAQFAPGQTVKLTLLRSGEEMTLEVILGERPATTP